MECRRHRTGSDSDEIPRRRRTGLVRDNQTDLDCGAGRPGGHTAAAILGQGGYLLSARLFRGDSVYAVARHQGRHAAGAGRHRLLVGGYLGCKLTSNYTSLIACLTVRRDSLPFGCICETIYLDGLSEAIMAMTDGDLKAVILRLNVIIALQLEALSQSSKNPIATRILKLAEFGLSPSEIGTIVGKKANYVSALVGTNRRRING